LKRVRDVTHLQWVEVYCRARRNSTPAKPLPVRKGGPAVRGVLRSIKKGWTGVPQGKNAYLSILGSYPVLGRRKGFSPTQVRKRCPARFHRGKGGKGVESVATGLGWILLGFNRRGCSAAVERKRGYLTSGKKAGRGAG